MVKFRMSMKSDKGDNKPHHISIPQKDAIAIVPPKKVIKALYDYSAPDSRYLSFSQGDFLHVVDREDDPTWYEACNPLQGSRGLVPAKYFEIVGKQARNSGGSAKSEQHYIPAGNHDSGYGGAAAPQNGVRMSKSMGRNAGAMVYGVVMYDFKAERPDELDAKEGEAIIVIAQSNPEWFVAKPITRLGGPGLIPVSFIEIRDMATNKPVEDPQEAVRMAGVPKVEEWKKMAADYKNGSIPLGKLDSGAAAMQQGMARMSLGSQQSQQQRGTPQSQYGAPNGYGMQPPRNGPLYGPQQYRNENLLSPIRASVPRYCFADDIFWFIVEAEMEDGRHWELQRLYQDFYDLQINLIQAFPREAGNVQGVERSLPYMPGPVTYVTDNISNGRRANLDEYIRNLLKLGQHITRDFLVCKFFAPREGDFEIEPDAADPYRMSSGSQGAPSNATAMSPPSTSGLSGTTAASNAYSSMGYGMNKNQPGGPGHMRNISQSTSPPPQNPYAQSMNPMAANGPTSQPALIKIKVFFGPENCVVIRLPPDFRFADLYKKLQERRRLEPGLVDASEGNELEICWRDENDKLWRMESDADLHAAMGRGNKLTLNVRSI